MPGEGWGLGLIGRKRVDGGDGNPASLGFILSLSLAGTSGDTPEDTRPHRAGEAAPGFGLEILAFFSPWVFLEARQGFPEATE